jgi:hypothetical protein
VVNSSNQIPFSSVIHATSVLDFFFEGTAMFKHCRFCTALALCGCLFFTNYFEAEAKPTCELSKIDKRYNATLDFEQFDQKGVGRSTARQLSNHNCYQAAADATADYLINRTIKSVDQQRVLLFHLGQYRALSGNELGAGDLIAATKDPSQLANDDRDWNDYVSGTWAFFTKNKELLMKAHAKLSRKTTPMARINSGVLTGLIRCFNKPYRYAYGSNCIPPRTIRP